MDNEKYIVIQGNPVDGLSFYGPFDSGDEANEFADKHLEADWWTTPLTLPSIASEGDFNVAGRFL